MSGFKVKILDDFASITGTVFKKDEVFDSSVVTMVVIDLAGEWVNLYLNGQVPRAQIIAESDDSQLSLFQHLEQMKKIIG